MQGWIPKGGPGVKSSPHSVAQLAPKLHKWLKSVARVQTYTYAHLFRKCKEKTNANRRYKAGFDFALSIITEVHCKCTRLVNIMIYLHIKMINL